MSFFSPAVSARSILQENSYDERTGNAKPIKF
jgi:hypothetical protein